MGVFEPPSVRMGALLTLAEVVSSGRASPQDHAYAIAASRKALASTEAPVVVGGIELAVATRDATLMRTVHQVGAGDLHGLAVSSRWKQWLQDQAQKALRK